MTASVENPIYSVYIVDGGNKYDISPAVIELDSSDQKKQMAQSFTINLMNAKMGSGWLSGMLKVRQRVYIYADDGSRNEEVFRGYIWTRGYKSSLTDREIALKCYDNLIYMQESEDAEYFSSGKSTKDVVSTLCGKWGVQLEYSYESITHTKLALRGNLADILTSDVLDLAKDRTGKQYVILSTKDVMQIKTVGSNAAVYKFKAGENAIQASSSCTMDGRITKVVILGKADEEDRQPVEATISGDTAQYGTLQKLISRNENTSLEDAKKEAQSIIDDNGTPKWEFELIAPDIPWIRKGDKVYVNAGEIANSTLIVTGVDRTISNKQKQMTLTLEPETAGKVSLADDPTNAAAASSASPTESTETTEDTTTEVQSTFTLSIKNTGTAVSQGVYTLYVNGLSRYSGAAKDLTLTLNYKDYVKIVPVAKGGSSYTLSDTDFNMKSDKTVTIKWTGSGNMEVEV